MSTEPRRDYGSILFAAFFILLGAWILWQTVGMSALGAVFPRTIAIAMIVFSIGLIVMNLLRAHGPAGEAKQPESMVRRAALVGVMLVWALVMPIVGFLVSSLGAFLLIIFIANYDPWTFRQAAVYGVAALAIVVGFYALFAYALNVPMPTGMLL